MLPQGAGGLRTPGGHARPGGQGSGRHRAVQTRAADLPVYQGSQESALHEQFQVSNQGGQSKHI